MSPNSVGRPRVGGGGSACPRGGLEEVPPLALPARALDERLALALGEVERPGRCARRRRELRVALRRGAVREEQVAVGLQVVLEAVPAGVGQLQRDDQRGAVLGARGGRGKRNGGK